MKKMITRRDFIKTAAVAAAATGMAFPQETAARRATVVLVRHADVLDANGAIDARVLQAMLDQAVTRLCQTPDAVSAFKTMVKPGETVGIKSNVWSYLPTPPELVQAIRQRLLDAGIKAESIGIDDHTVRTNPLFVNATSLFNARPLRTHYLAGVSGCIKNYIMFAESQPDFHPDNCADLGALFKLPQVKGKTRLNILCALTPQFHGRGPHHFSRRYVWNYKGLIVSTDPVATDTIGLQLIMAKRREVLGPEMALPPVPKHIQLADTRHGIGVGDPSRIELVKIGWPEEILI